MMSEAVGQDIEKPTGGGKRDDDDGNLGGGKVGQAVAKPAPEAHQDQGLIREVLIQQEVSQERVDVEKEHGLGRAKVYMNEGSIQDNMVQHAHGQGHRKNEQGSIQQKVPRQGHCNEGGQVMCVRGRMDDGGNAPEVLGSDGEELSLMQNGAQEGYMDDDDEIQPFVEEFEMRIRMIRGQDPRKARNLVHLVTNYMIRGLRSKLPSLRQVSRAIQTAVDNVWPDLEPLVNVHVDSHATWTSKFWKRVRTACRKCSHSYRKRKAVLQEAREGTRDAEREENNARPVCENGEGREPQEDVEEEMDVVSTMQRAVPPWRRQYNPRAKWLRDRDESPRRRRPDDHRKWRRDRSPSRPRKGRSKGSKPSSSTSVRKLGDKVCPKDDQQAKHGDEGSEVEVVADEEEGQRMTAADAVQLWRRLIEFSPEGETGQPMGLPDYMLDNLRATAADMDAAEVHTMLAALVQLQALVVAQATEVLNERLQDIAAEDWDESTLMQGSMTIASPLDGISTFGYWLQKASDALSAMGSKDARICAKLLQKELRNRYGSGGGRAMMGERARGLRTEEMAIAHSMLNPVEVESQGSMEATLPVSSASVPAMTSTDSDVNKNDKVEKEDPGDMDDELREAEEEEIRQATRLHKEWEARQQKDYEDYEQSVRDEERADEWRLREYEAMVAQDWDDWAMSSAMVSPVQRQKRQRLRAVLQVHDRFGAVTDKAEVQGNLTDLSNVTVTIGLQVAQLPLEAEGQGEQGHGLSATTRLTESALPVGSESHAEVKGKPKEHAPTNLVEFLASEEGQRAFRFWRSGVLSSRRLVQEYGDAVLDAFETQRVALDSL